jgi:hypothetical protein
MYGSVMEECHGDPRRVAEELDFPISMSDILLYMEPRSEYGDFFAERRVAAFTCASAGIGVVDTDEKPGLFEPTGTRWIDLRFEGAGDETTSEIDCEITDVIPSPRPSKSCPTAFVFSCRSFVRSPLSASSLMSSEATLIYPGRCCAVGSCTLLTTGEDSLRRGFLKSRGLAGNTGDTGDTGEPGIWCSTVRVAN